MVFGQILGTKIGKIAGATICFIAPGLIMNIIVVESFNNLAFSTIEKYHHAIDDYGFSAGELSILLDLWLVALVGLL